MLPMQTLGKLLKNLRQQRGLTQEKLALKAQVTARVLRYWESDAQFPREAELENVLNALEASAQEKKLIYALLPDTRMVRIVQNVAVANRTAASLLGQMLGIGDLMRAMRLRRSWTQEQFAEEMKVSRSSVLRWEATRNLPSEEDMERLCHLLNASPEERAAVLSRRLLPTHWSPQLTLEECRQQYELLMQIRGGNSALLPLAVLYTLALKRQVRLLLAQSSEALRLLAMVEVQHGWWLYMQGRFAEACAANWRGLNMVRGTFAPEDFWTRALNLLAAHASQGKNGAENSVRLLYPWLRILPPSLQFVLLCDIALYAGWAHRSDEAAQFLSRAEHLMSQPSNPDTEQHWHSRYLFLTKARVLLSSGKPLEAMVYLPTPSPLGDGRVHDLLIWAEMLLAAGDKNTASGYLNEAQTVLNAMSLPHRQNKLDQLAQQL